MFYFNPDEPKLFVPKRTGIPFTLNFAKPAAWAITLTTIALIAFAFAINNRFLLQTIISTAFSSHTGVPTAIAN